jgi:hypothetical protein
VREFIAIYFALRFSVGVLCRRPTKADEPPKVLQIFHVSSFMQEAGKYPLQQRYVIHRDSACAFVVAAAARATPSLWHEPCSMKRLQVCRLGLHRRRLPAAWFVHDASRPPVAHNAQLLAAIEQCQGDPDKIMQIWDRTFASFKAESVAIAPDTVRMLVQSLW